MSWREIRQNDLAAWNQRLLQEPAALMRQYPFFNEGLRGSGGLWVSKPGRRFAALIAAARRWTTSPRYLVYEPPGGQHPIFASVVTIGVPGLRFGCILDGPVTHNGCPMDAVAADELVRWGRRNNYVALRLTHSSETFLDSLAAFENTERVDGVPFYPHPAKELYVSVSPDEAAMLSAFQKVARQEIRHARDAGYRISIDTDPEALQRAWPAFESRSAQKGISYRALDTYTRIMRGAQPHGAAHLYTAWLDENPLAAALVLRDRSTAHYFLGTVAVDALGDRPSPACLVQVTAMRHAAEMGATAYNLGTRSGSVYSFKAKFRPVEREWPAPLTFIINQRLYDVWRRMLPSVSEAVH